MKWVFFLSTALLWPLGLFLSLKSEPTGYLLGILVSSILFTIALVKGKSWAFVLLFPLALFSPKLVLIPILFGTLTLIQNPRKFYVLAVGALVLVSMFFVRDYVNQTIFKFDYEAQQKVLRDTKLYPSVFTARLFHNKGRIVSDKFVGNFLALTDPNNYFFGFHPRQIVRENLNLRKFPIILIPFLILWILHKKKVSQEERQILIFLVICLLSLSTLANVDRVDIVLFGPLCALSVTALQTTYTKVHRLLQTTLFIFCLWEITYFLATFF